jgi:hypothetical protein
MANNKGLTQLSDHFNQPKRQGISNTAAALPVEGEQPQSHRCWSCGDMRAEHF